MLVVGVVVVEQLFMTSPSNNGATEPKTVVVLVRVCNHSVTEGVFSVG
jgi:hypothetical protein